MKGILNPQQQLNVLSRIWGNDREGYVFLPWINGKAADRNARKAGYHEGPAFEWPSGKDKILAHLAAHPADDVYFAPCLFVINRRVEQAADLERVLWADLDEVDPNGIDHNLRPTIAWESSPGRWQAVWLLSHPIEGASWMARENHRLTNMLGADPSGWDTTQLLRVPGRPNHKPDYRETNGGRPVPGQLLWDTGPRYTPDDVRDGWDLPAMEIASVVDDADEDVINSIDRHEVWGRVRLKVSVRVRQYMAIRRESDIQLDEGVDRSNVIWEISRDLADAGCNVAEIVAVIRPSVWNKFRGRGDELKQLKSGALKAISERKRADGTSADDGALEDADDVERPEVRWLNNVMSIRMRRPAWLIHNIWSRGGCGFIAGDPKSYKSWTGLDMAVSVATGTPFLNDPQFRVVGGPQPVIYLQEEDPEIVVRDRLETILEGKASDQHWHGQVRMEGRMITWAPPVVAQIPLAFFVRIGFVASDRAWQAWLTEMAGDIRSALIVVDTLGTTAGDVDTDRAQDLMTKILRPLRQVSQATGSGIAVVHHNRKGSNGDRGGMKMLGSVALHAWVDDAIYVHSRETKGSTTHVRVERESKAAVEQRWTLEIPRMGLTDVYGGRNVWAPVTGQWDSTPAEGVTGTEHASTGRGAPAGARMTTRLKTMGGDKRPIPFARIVEVCGITASSARKQLESAITAGEVKGNQEAGYRLA